MYVTPPEEDKEEGQCGKRLKASCGTMDVAPNWEHAYLEALEGMGFKRGTVTPCILYMAESGLRVVVHGGNVPLLNPIPSRPSK